jgi:hypothetical protein
MQFKKGSFEVGSVIYPVAIKVGYWEFKVWDNIIIFKMYFHMLF